MGSRKRTTWQWLAGMALAVMTVVLTALALAALTGCAIKLEPESPAAPTQELADPLYDRSYAPSPDYRIPGEPTDGYSRPRHLAPQVIPLQDAAPPKR